MKTRITPPGGQNVATDLSTFLLNLAADAGRPRRLDKDTLHVYLPKDLTVQVRLLVEAVRLIVAEGNTDDVVPDSFRADTLVAHLLREFLTTHQSAVDDLVALSATARRQNKVRQVADLERLMVVNHLLEP